jgi:hypothetical protein
MGPRPRPPEERFWKKVDKIGPVPTHRPDLGRCWLWTGSTRSTPPYGQFRVGSMTDGTRRVMPAHQFSYEVVNGPVPPHRQIDHLCRVPLCVNPDHLEAVTQRTNILRGTSPSAAHAARTHCPQGHPYDLVNTYFRPDGSRDCRACQRTKVAS